MKFLSKLGKQIDERYQAVLSSKALAKRYFQKAEKKLQKIIKLEKKILSEFEQREKDLQLKEEAFRKLVQEKTVGFPWLTEVISEFEKYIDLDNAHFFRHKKHAAIKASEIVAKISKEKKYLKKELKLAQNFVAYYETLFPWLRDYVDENLNDILIRVREEKNIKKEEDPVQHYMKNEEYYSLSSTERNQLALDRYLNSTKAKR